MLPSSATNRYQVAANLSSLKVSGAASQLARYEANGFVEHLLAMSQPPRRGFDLMRIAAGAYVIDRIVRRQITRDNEYGCRTLPVTFAVQEPRFWKSGRVSSLVHELLRFLTADDWSVTFEKSTENFFEGCASQFLSVASPFQAKRISLYSGGLDSAAGFAQQTLSGNSGHVLVTVGHQSSLKKTVHSQLTELAKAMGKEENDALPWLHAALIINLENSKRLDSQERTQRVRAFLFFAAAAVAAMNHKVSQVDVFENGIGALNFPLMAGMLGTGLATRGAHPAALQIMSALASEVADSSITFGLPNRWRTKGQVLSSLRENGLNEWLQKTTSCAHSTRKVGKHHCGVCPACIERRQAFRISGIGERADDYVRDIFKLPPEGRDESDYFALYKDDASDLLAGDARVLRRLENHLRITDVASSDDARVRDMLMIHAREVEKIYGPSEFSKLRANAAPFLSEQ